MLDDGDLGLSNRKILKCPFCGSDGVLKMMAGSDDFYDFDDGELLSKDSKESNFYTVSCSNKDCIANSIADYWGSSDEAIDAWNMRRGVIPSIKAMGTNDIENKENSESEDKPPIDDDNSLINVVNQVLKSNNTNTDKGTYVDKDGNRYEYKVYNLSKGSKESNLNNQSTNVLSDKETNSTTADRYVVFDTKKLTYRYLNTICETTYIGAYLKCLGLCKAKGYSRKKVSKRYRIIKIPVRFK